MTTFVIDTDNNITAFAALEDALNYRGLPCFEATALSGDGVFDTLRAMSELVLRRLASGFATPAAAR